MDISVTSRETIKPSSPTPHHLRHLKLSLIDQNMNGSFTRVLLFYSAQGDLHRFRTTNISDRLKKSLSEVLTEFYPVAGTISNNQSIHCNDEGLEYIEARVKSPFTLGQLLSSPPAEELSRLFPDESHLDKLSAVRVTVFDGCGGMAIGVSISHVVADASSLAVFVNSWAGIARGDASRTPPKFGFASFFPPRDMPVINLSDFEEAGSSQLKLVTKRFVFPQMKIDSLKANFAYKCPTRVEAAFALIFKCLINADTSRSSKSVGLCMAISLRSRMSPPVPMHCFGNFALPMAAEHIGPASLNDLGVEIRKLIKQMDGDSLEKLLADDGLLLCETFGQLPNLFMNNDRVVVLTSWCKLPFYEVDVGWGVPTWATTFFPNQDDVILLDAKNGDGIEAWVSLDEDSMASFESDKELLDFACPNPMVYEL